VRARSGYEIVETEMLHNLRHFGVSRSGCLSGQLFILYRRYLNQVAHPFDLTTQGCRILHNDFCLVVTQPHRLESLAHAP